MVHVGRSVVIGWSVELAELALERQVRRTDRYHDVQKRTRVLLVVYGTLRITFAVMLWGLLWWAEDVPPCACVIPFSVLYLHARMSYYTERAPTWYQLSTSRPTG